jgi:hypothetical protein
MNLCYNRQSGHGGGWVGWVRGSRVINLNYDDLWAPTTSYIRLENGNVTDHFPVQNGHINKRVSGKIELK